MAAYGSRGSLHVRLDELHCYRGDDGIPVSMDASHSLGFAFSKRKGVHDPPSCSIKTHSDPTFRFFANGWPYLLLYLDKWVAHIPNFTAGFEQNKQGLLCLPVSV